MRGGQVVNIAESYSFQRRLRKLVPSRILHWKKLFAWFLLSHSPRRASITFNNAELMRHLETPRERIYDGLDWYFAQSVLPGHHPVNNHKYWVLSVSFFLLFLFYLRLTLTVSIAHATSWIYVHYNKSVLIVLLNLFSFGNAALSYTR